MYIHFHEYITGFEHSEFFIEENYKEIETLRRNFVSDYSPKAIMNMEIDEYIVGKGDKNTFCSRLETELKGWGNIQGSTAIKFGVYYGTYGDSSEDYQYAKKFGNSLEEAFNRIKGELTNLIKSGSVKNYDEINNNLMSPTVKGKILSVYYPDDYLNIFSSSHLDFFANQLNLGIIDGLSEIDKQRIILEYKNNDFMLKGWNIPKFGKFLYYLFGSPTNKNVKGIINENKSNRKVDVFPSPNDLKYELIDLIPKSNITSSFNSKEKKIWNTDFAEQNRINKRIGDKGELIVLQYEKDKLGDCDKKELIEKINHVLKKMIRQVMIYCHLMSLGMKCT